MLISMAIAYMASLASWALVFSTLSTWYWAWVAAIVACVTAFATYEITELYMTRRVWPVTRRITRGTWDIVSGATRAVSRTWARREHNHV